jgi:hypothetical protein
LTNCTVSGNSAEFEGGIENLRTLTVSNSTISGNTATRLTGGIGTVADAGHNATASLLNCTIVNNTVDRSDQTGSQLFSGGGSLYHGTIQLRNTIISGNGPGPNLFAETGSTFATQGHNLSSDNGGGFLTGPGDQTSTNPLLGPLQDNGGPTKTMALLAGSPALNAGDPAQLGVADQRGVVRAGGVNIGAYQASASTFVVTVSGAVASGTPFDVTVQAVDVFGQVAFGYRGTVTFRVTDPDSAVVLPAHYTFTADDQGTHTFTGEFTLITPGMWTLTAADLANDLTKDVMVTVDS